LYADVTASWPRDYTSSLLELDYAFCRFDRLANAFDSGIEGVTRRRGILQVRYGPRVFHKQVLQPGERIVVGSDERADFVLAGDASLAGRHLEVWWDGVVAQVRTLTDAAVTLDGAPTWRGELTNGGSLVVGRFTLRFFVEALSSPREPVEPLGDQAAVRRRLSAAWVGGQLFAVIDAARDARALRLLEESIDEHASLYEGDRGRGLDGEAPYLVRFSPRSGLLGRLLAEGWGRAWGIYLSSASAPKMLRRSLRRLLMVDADTRPDPLYFRFYDPRVLRRFAPLATTRQRSEMLAEADTLFYELADASLAEMIADVEEADA
jgi:hypothetical protein